MPLVTAEYRTDTTKQILAGHSLGDLFALHALFHAPGLFHGIVAASPSLWYDDRAIFSSEEDYAQNNSVLPAKLHMSVGQKEEGMQTQMVSNLFRFSAILESRKYTQLSLKNQLFADLDHHEAMVPGFQMGLKWLFHRAMVQSSWVK